MKKNESKIIKIFLFFGVVISTLFYFLRRLYKSKSGRLQPIETDFQRVATKHQDERNSIERVENGINKLEKQERTDRERIDEAQSIFDRIDKENNIGKS